MVGWRTLALASCVMIPVLLLCGDSSGSNIVSTMKIFFIRALILDPSLRLRPAHHQVKWRNINGANVHSHEVRTMHISSSSGPHVPQRGRGRGRGRGGGGGRGAATTNHHEYYYNITANDDNATTTVISHAATTTNTMTTNTTNTKYCCYWYCCCYYHD